MVFSRCTPVLPPQLSALRGGQQDSGLEGPRSGPQVLSSEQQDLALPQGPGRGLVPSRLQSWWDAQLAERTGTAGTGVPAAGRGQRLRCGAGGVRAAERPSPRRGCATPFSATHLLAVPVPWLTVGLVRPGCWGPGSSASPVTLCPQFAPAQPPSLPAPGVVVSQAPALPAGAGRVFVLK